MESEETQTSISNFKFQISNFKQIFKGCGEDNKPKRGIYRRKERGGNSNSLETPDTH
jgi:hypothetical protein